MTIVIPAMSIEQQRIEICPSVQHEGIIGNFKKFNRYILFGFFFYFT